MNKRLNLILISGVFLLFSFSAQAADLGEQVDFFVDSSYDYADRIQLTATLRAVGDHAYFYVDNDYYDKLSGTMKNGLREKLEDLSDEFDDVIYPKLRAVYGSEWNPGIDGDSKITILVSQLVNSAGGYINTYDALSKTTIPSSNEREMIYLNALNIFNKNNKAFLAHEFQHLITLYQKSIVHGKEEEVWLNEARSEYAPTICGYNDVYNGGYLASRVGSFLESPSDSLTEWKNEVADYGAANLFLHYLVGQYGEEVLTRTMMNDQVGIASITKALENMEYTETFNDVFGNWAIANYLNDCNIGPDSKYCYLDSDLTYSRMHVDYSASYSGFPNLIVSRSSSIKDWSAYWYRFRQNGTVSTERDTLKLEFEGLGDKSDFKVPYIVSGYSTPTTVQYLSLEDQKGSVYIPNFTSLNKSVILMPFNQYKEKNFGSDESSTAFSFTAASVTTVAPVIGSLTPGFGPSIGGIEIVIKGDNFTNIKKIEFGGMNISNFTIRTDSEIAFLAPVHEAGSVDVKLTDNSGQEATLKDAFTYSDSGEITEYPDGSLLRAQGDHRVYIVKGNYKRWIQTAEIFNNYGHLTWDDIIDVSPSVLAQYQEAWMIRAAGDKKVYELNADASKHWLNMTAEQFSLTGHLWEMVFIVNDWERDFYTTGADVMFVE